MARTCSECGTPLTSRSGSYTCSDKCRAARSRRLRRVAQQEAALAGEGIVTSQVREYVNNHAYSAIQKTMEHELAPIVREALTEDVLRAVQGMLGLTSRAVELLQQDLESTDDVVRQRAYTLVMKYTVGHPALLQAKDTDPQGQMVVNFNLPRPEMHADEETELVESVELRRCDICEQDKPVAEFVAGSSRCQSCHEDWKQKIQAEFG